MAGRVVTPKVITKFPLEAFHSTYCQWYSVKLNLKPCLGLALPHKETQWRYTQRLLYLLKNPHYLTFHFLNKSEVNKWGLEKQKNTYIHFHCFNSIQYVPKSKVIDWKNESVSDKVINRFDFCQPSWKRNVFFSLQYQWKTYNSLLLYWMTKDFKLSNMARSMAHTFQCIDSHNLLYLSL